MGELKLDSKIIEIFEFFSTKVLSTKNDTYTLKICVGGISDAQHFGRKDKKSWNQVWIRTMGQNGIFLPKMGESFDKYSWNI